MPQRCAPEVVTHLTTRERARETAPVM